MVDDRQPATFGIRLKPLIPQRFRFSLDRTRANMALRFMASEARDFPATAIFCLLWIAVFAAMVGTRLAAGVPIPFIRWLVLGIGDGHRFGDLALDDINLAHGKYEYWRLMTSTFVHFSVMHLVLNLIAMYQLGTMVESWYGKYQAVFIYGLTGGGGNLVSALIRYVIGSNPRIHSGGGSVVIMGLVGLCAVVGLRSRSELGWSLGRLMVGFMVATAFMGAMLPQFIDNWGHAGGAVVGIAVGFAHRQLLQAVHKPAGWGRGVVMGILIVACATAQAAADRREAPLREEQTLARRVSELERNYQVLARTALLVRRRGDTKTILKLLDIVRASPASGRALAAGLGKLRAMAQPAPDGRLSDEQTHEMGEYLTPLVERARRDFVAERKKLWRFLQRQPYERSR
jgi:rhomboid protease GluP